MGDQMRKFLLMLVATSASFINVVSAQELLLFPASSFGDIVLPRTESALGDITFEAQIGDYDNEFISSYGTSSFFAETGRAVGRLDILTDKGHAPCTAFLVDENRLITNHHCVPGILNDPRVQATKIVAVQFKAGYLQDGIEEGTKTFHVDPAPLETSEELDYTVLQVIGDPNAEFGSLRLSNVTPKDGDPYWVIGHPLGEAQRISRANCQASTPALSASRLRHTCDTLPGNSGSPVIDAGLQTVIALHHAGSRVGSINYAVPMVDILAHSEVLMVSIAKVDASPITECDIMAGHPSDPSRVHPGMEYALLRPGPAIEVCRTALAEDPDNPRLMTQLARALAKGGQPEEAIELNQRAVDLGYLGGYHNLGNHYRRGDGVERDHKKAFALFLHAAENGHAEDAYNVGNMYRKGQGVAKDLDKAWHWFERASHHDYPTAFDRLGLMMARGEGQNADLNGAVDYFQRGAELGDASAMVNLGTAYRKGTGIDIDLDAAFQLYWRAAQLRRRSAYTNLAEMYRKGQGREVDLMEAAFWYQLAAREGHTYSQEKLAELSQGLTKAEIEEIEERVQEWITSNFG